ncbi:MAG: PAS domain S-box protein [Deltaproteobacteria bacterium]|nr:PAS domain S-box protein [Deltaproteobacteria bacterium]
MDSMQPNNDFMKRMKELEKDLTQCRDLHRFSVEREKMLELIVQGISIPALVVDENHVITHCNRSYERFKGISAEKMIGTKNQWMSFYSTPRPVMVDFLVDGVSENKILKHFGRRCRKSPVAEGAFEAEVFFPELGENGKWLFFTAAPLIDETGHLVGAVETIQDVTQRRRAEDALRHSERRFRSFLDFAPYPMGVFTMEGLPTYLNPRFTEVFGWTLEELEGKKIPFVPEEEKRDTIDNLRKLYREKILKRHESKRFTKDGRLLDVAIRAAIYSESKEGPSGVVAIFRDITREKRTAGINAAMLNISLALPRYPNLEDLLDYVNEEVKRLLDSEGSIFVMLDEERQEFIILGAAYDQTRTEKRVKEVRFPIDQLVAGRAVRTGKPIIVSDTSQDRRLHEERDRKLGYKTRNLAVVPWKGGEGSGGALCAVNKKHGDFDRSDIELLEMIAGTVTLSIENARVSGELKKAYAEVSSLNRAKDKAIGHLSHELKTPVAVLSGSLNLLTRYLPETTEEKWKDIMAMAKRNLERIKDIQGEAQDIMEGRENRFRLLLSNLLDLVTDELAVLFTQETGAEDVVGKVRKRIDEVLGYKEAVSESLRLDLQVKKRLKYLEPFKSHRQVEILAKFESTPPVFLPEEVLQKVIDGLIRNALENTPDEGKIEISVAKKGEGSLLIVRDFGIGIHEEAKSRILEGYFTTQDIMNYSTKRPFDFGAGGKGADLLRMKIFSERYHFEIDLDSSRCRHIPMEKDLCPGSISRCKFCKGPNDCYESGGTVFTVYFPPPPK